VAKAPTSRSSGPDPALLIEGLRKALSGAQPLLGKDALFASTAKGKELARVAVEEGYLASRTETIPPAGKKGKAKEIVLAELTPKGRQHVLESDSPKKVLEALLPAVQALSGGPKTAAPPDAVRPEVERAARACVQAIEEGFAKLHKTVETAMSRLEQTVVKALPAAPVGAPPDPATVLAVLREALARVTRLVRLYYDVQLPERVLRGELYLAVRPSSIKLWAVAATAGVAVTVRGLTAVAPTLLHPEFMREDLLASVSELLAHRWLDWLCLLSIPLIRVGLGLLDRVLRLVQER
jgi:hypothetical protein